MKRIGFHPSAIDDISAIRDFIGRDSKATAKNVVTGLLRSIAQLAIFPRTGRRGQVTGTHELVVRRLPYIVVYRISGNDVEIIAIVHMARNGPRKTIK